MKQAITMGLLGCGVLLLILSFVWPLLFGTKTALSVEDFDQLEKLEQHVEQIYLKAQAHQRRTGSKSPPAEAAVAMEKVVKERDALREKLESGIQQPDSNATLFWYVGIGAVLIGVASHLVTQPS